MPSRRQHGEPPRFLQPGPPDPEQVEFADSIRTRLQDAGVDNVLAVWTPHSHSDRWTLVLHAGGRNTTAHDELTRLPRVVDVRRSEQSGSLIGFRVKPAEAQRPPTP